MQDVTVPAERWTQERRRQHTRDLLLDAAEQVFAQRGFDGASLEEIAETAGYTRGAIYKHFGSKEELFLAANERFNERYVQTFTDMLDPEVPADQIDLSAVARRWAEMHRREAGRSALGAEFNLYVLRHPECREQVAAQFRRTAEMVAGFIEQQAKQSGMKTRMPTLTLARLALAASDGIALATRFDDPGDDDLHEAFLELLITAWEPIEAPKKKAAKKP